MASGLPIIGPRSGGITSYAHERNALLVNPDPESFARAAVLLRENQALGEAHRRAGRATAEEFDWPLATSAFFQLYEELYAIMQDNHEPALAPVFYSSYSSIRRGFGCE